MEENRQMTELLERIEKNSRRQARFAAVQCAFSLAAAVFCAVAVILMLRILPQINEVLPRVSGAVEQMQGILGNMETATEQLASIDLGGMVADVDTLVTTAQNSLTETMKKLDTVDFKALNKAISDLSAVVEPLSRVMKAFS